jgi:cysteine sulfinate desulfinase/cysteine desulfurase-like protein
MKKSMMVAVALICMTMTSIVFTSCKSEEKTEIVTEKVFYQLDGNDLQYVKGHEDVVLAFNNDLTEVMQSVSYTYVKENELIDRLQAVVDTYNNQYIKGNLKLLKSTDATNFTTIRTFTMKFAE